MLNIVTEIAEVNKPSNNIIAIASDMRNYNKFLPSDKVSDWKAEEKECSFKIKSFAELYDDYDIKNKVKMNVF